MVGQRDILSAALSAHVSELRLFWRETGVSCRWLIPDAEHCLVDEETLQYLLDFRKDAQTAIINPDVRSEWQGKASLLLDESEAGSVPFPLRTLTWLLRVVESPHREDLTIDSWNLYLWSVRLADLPSRILQKLSAQLEGSEKKALLDFDTLAAKYFAARSADFSLYDENEDEAAQMLNVERFDRLRRFKNLVFYGIANIGKANLSKQLIAQWKERTGREIGMHCVTVFHPATAYGDLVERRTAGAARSTQTTEELPCVLGSHSPHASFFFEHEQNTHIEDGLFVALCREAVMHPDKDYLFMVECIDRAKIEEVLGELAHMLDAFARVPWKMGLLPSQRGWDLTAGGARSVRLGLSGRLFFVPANVYCLGTATEKDLFAEKNDKLLQCFAFERLEPLSQSQLLRRMLSNRSPAAFARLEEYAEHSVALWAEINGILHSAGGETNLIGYGPLFSMCEEILQSADVHEAARIVLGTWRYRMLPPILMKMTALLAHHTNSHRQHLGTLMESINRSWLRTRISLEGLFNSESLQVSYDTQLNEEAPQA